MEKTKQFLTEVQSELTKVNWPDKKSVYGSTGVVIVTTLLTLGLLWVLDIIFSTIFRMIF